MMKGLPDRAHVPLGKNELAKIRTKAIMRGVWFKASVLASIIEKLLDATDSKVVRLMREVGRALAQKFSLIAQKWGNKSAHQWIADLGFVQYLTINHMNTPASFWMWNKSFKALSTA